MFTVKDQDLQKKAVASRSKSLDGQVYRGTQMREPVGSLRFLQRNLGNGYIQANNPTINPMAVGADGLRLQRACACGSSCANCAPQGDGTRILQPKLTIGSPNDRYEQEADRVADQVMQNSNPAVQRQIESEEEEERMVQKQVIPYSTASNSGQFSSEFPSLGKVLNSSGSLLDSKTRTFMESRFRRNFNQVRIHTNSQANEMARILNARAFTVRQNIVFGAGQYQPDTQNGQKLIAHELTHTVQQSVLNGVTPVVQRQLYPPIPIVVRPSTAVEINAVDARQQTGTSWYKPWRYTGPITNFFRGDVTMTNTASMVANVIAFLQGRRMHRLNIMDHGNQDGVEIGDDWLTSAANVVAFAGVLGGLRPHFASDAIVHFQNCQSGQNQALICALAAAFGKPVYAGTGSHNPLLGFNLGDYVRCDPSGTFNPNAGRPSTPTPPPADANIA